MAELSTLGIVIKTAYEGEADTNAFTDAEKSKLAGLNGDVSWGDITGVPAALTSAQAAGTASIRAIGTTATTAAAGNHTHTPAAIGAATAAQGALADTAVQPGDLPQGIAVADAADETEVVGQFNALLSSLRAAGLIET